MGSARPDAPAKLRALRRLADGEPGAQEMSTADSNHLWRHGLVDIDRLPGGVRRHTVTAAGWALLDGEPTPGEVLQSANPPRPGHGIAVGDVVAYGYRHPLSRASRVRHAFVVGFDELDDGEHVVLEDPGRPGPMRRPLAAVTRVDPLPTAYREDLSSAPSAPRADGTGERLDGETRTVEFQGTTYELSHADVEARMHGLMPDRITKYFVEVGGHAYPVKQVARTCTGVYQQKTRELQKLLRDLGFTVHQSS